MFSVVIPAYNCEKTICDVLDSVLNQSRFDLIDEIIIVNDGSTDNTKQTIEDYISIHPQKGILLISQSNMGVSKARNQGILAASGEWIALLDSDDIWLPYKIEKQYAIINEIKNISFLGCDYPLKLLFKKYKSGIVKLSPRQLCIRYTPCTPSVVFKREEGISLGLFDEKMGFSEDINFYQRFFLKDSYYILVERLVICSIGKKYFNETGLSSHLKEMKNGRNKNIIEMKEMGLITNFFKFLMLMFSEIKYIRRLVFRGISRFIN